MSIADHKQVPYKLLNQVKSLKASAKVLLDAASETEMLLNKFLAPASRKGRDLSEKRKAEISAEMVRNSSHK